MSGKKRKTVDYNWVDENIISRIPTECIEKVKPLQESVNQWKQNKESISIPSVSSIKFLVLSLAESDSALVVTSWVAQSGRCRRDIQSTPSIGGRFRVCG